MKLKQNFRIILCLMLIGIFMSTSTVIGKQYFCEDASNSLWEQRNGGFNGLLSDVLNDQGFPWDEDSVPLGCTAVALGIMMRHHQWPPSSRSIDTHEDKIWTYEQIVHTVPSFRNEDQTYDWSNMPIDPLQATDEIEKLLYHTAVSIRMNWGWNGQSFFGMCPLERQGTQYRSEWFDDDWRYRTPTDYGAGVSMKEDVIESIKWGLPVPFWVGEHTAIYTGYDSNNDKFYINWGWGNYAHCDGDDCENNWYEWPATGEKFTFPDGEKMGPRHTEVPYCAPEHWTFVKQNCEGDHDGTAKEPYDDFDDALNWIDNEVLTTYNAGVINLWTGSYTVSDIIDTPCELRAINGDVLLSGSSYNWEDISYGLGVGFTITTYEKSVSYSINIDGLVILGKEKHGIIPPQSTETINIHPIGLGPINIKIKVGSVERSYSSFLLGFFTLNMKEMV